MSRGRSLIAAAALLAVPALTISAMPAFADDGLQVTSVSATPATTALPTSKIMTAGSAIAFSPTKLTTNSSFDPQCGGGQAYGFKVINTTGTVEQLTYKGTNVGAPVKPGKARRLCVIGKAGKSGTFSTVADTKATLKVTIG